MKEKFIQNAVNNFLNEGYSCSESVVKAAFDIGMVDKSAISIATSFSGGMSSRCACGALTGAQIVIGFIHGKLKDNTARALAKEMYDKFCEKYKVACCKVLSSGFKDFHSKERKLHCVNMVKDSCDILYDIVESAKVSA